jgi:hypothetical protein
LNLKRSIIPVRCCTPWFEELSPSRSLAVRGQPHLPPCYLRLPPAQMELQDSKRIQQRHDTSPPPQCLPLSGVDSMPMQAGPRCHIPPPASPFIGVDGRLNREGGTQQQPTSLPADPSLSSAASSWASLVRDRMSASSSPTSLREDFFHLYERYVTSGLRARVAIRKAAGLQEILLSYRLQPSLIVIAVPLA